MQDQTTYTNIKDDDCNPPRGDDAVSNVQQCRNGEGPVVYNFYNQTHPLVDLGCQYTYIRYAPCLPDEAVTRADVQLNTTVVCNGPPPELKPVEDMTDSEFMVFVGQFIQDVVFRQKANGVPVTNVFVESICGKQVGNGRRLAAETAHRRMQTGSVAYSSAIYYVTAEVTTECGDSCAGVDFTPVETALESSIVDATENTSVTESVVFTELASTG